MGGTDYDDSNSAILYSSGWTAQTGTDSRQFQSTSHTTTVQGASATIKFQGTRLVLYLTVPMGSGESSISWTMDGANPGSNTKHRHDGTTYYQDNWYDSGNLASGTHTFVVSNAEAGAMFVFDKVNIEGTLISAQPPAPAKPVTTPTPTPTRVVVTVVNTQTVTQGPSQGQTQVQTVVQTVSTTVVQSSSGSASASAASETASSSTASSASSSSSTITQPQHLNGTTTAPAFISTQYITTGADGATSMVRTVTQLPASSSSPDTLSAAQKSTFPLGAVIGGVIGGIALIILGLILFCLMRRRNTASKFGRLQESGSGGDVERETSQRRRPTDISPFHLDNNFDPSRMTGAGAAAVSRSASNSSAASGHFISEKTGHHFAASSSPSSNGHSGTASEGSPGASTFNPSPTTAIPQQPEVDAGVYLPHDPNIDTTGMVLAYVPANHHLLQSPRDSRGAPPSYQSAATRAAQSRPESTATRPLSQPRSAGVENAAPPPLPPLAINEALASSSLNLSTSINRSAVTLDYVTPTSASEAHAGGLSRSASQRNANTELGDMPWARGW